MRPTSYKLYERGDATLIMVATTLRALVAGY